MRETGTLFSLLCKKGILHFSHVIEDGLLVNYMVITLQKK